MVSGSRYLVRSSMQLRCGVSFDEDPPFTLEIIDVESTYSGSELQDGGAAPDD